MSNVAVSLTLTAACSTHFFFFNDTATTEIYTLSLHDALPILWRHRLRGAVVELASQFLLCTVLQLDMLTLVAPRSEEHTSELQSRNISYAVFCLKKKIEVQLQRVPVHSLSNS